MELYFAYGSNLDERQMVRRCPSARFVATAYAPRMRLAFRSHSIGWGGAVATLVDAGRRARAPGVVYAMSREDVNRLDRFEGHPFRYVRQRMNVRALDGGRTISAWTYFLDRGPFADPSPLYLATIYLGYVSHGLDPSKLPPVKRPTPSKRAQAPRKLGQAPRKLRKKSNPYTGWSRDEILEELYERTGQILFLH